ncbi:MAG: metal-dependent hydrolase [Oscillospiraceae bacterium]|nr:metal-dependent hydrolase [Oscillospiraceae bacterium]
MLIAHIPTGYLVAKAMKHEKKSLIFSSMLFSVLPDLGLIYFYLVSRQVSHRTWFPHLPVVLLGTFLVTFPFYHIKRFEKARPFYVLFFVNWLVHLVQDSFTEQIRWLYPIVDRGFGLIEIPANFDHWIISFVFHWSFLVEIAIALVALVVFVRVCRTARNARENSTDL